MYNSMLIRPRTVHGVLQLLLPLALVTRLSALWSSPGLKTDAGTAFGRRQGWSSPLRDEHLPARALHAYDFTPRVSPGLHVNGFRFTRAEAQSAFHHHVRVFNPAALTLRDGSLLVMYRVGTNTMCIGTQYGKLGSIRDRRYRVRKLGAVLLDASTLRPLGRSTDVRVSLHTAAGGDVRCADAPQGRKFAHGSAASSVGDLAIHLQDVRLFTWGGLPHAIITVGNCEQLFGYGSTRLYIARVDPTNLRTLGRPYLVVVKDMRFIKFHKNWTPIVDSKNGLTLELEMEPRQLVVLSNAAAVLQGAPVDAIFEARASDTDIVSNAAMYLWQNERRCTLRGGAPALRLPDLGAWQGASGSHISLGLAHFVSGTDVYKHVFYTFDWRRPRLITGISKPFRLPTLAHIVSDNLRGDLGGAREVPPLVQFATGLVLLGDGKTLLISFGEKDCAGGFATIPLKRAMASVERFGNGDIDPFKNFKCWPGSKAHPLMYLNIAGTGVYTDAWYPLREKRTGDVSGALGHDTVNEGGSVHDRSREWTLPQCASICHVMERCAGFASVATDVRSKETNGIQTRKLNCYYFMKSEDRSDWLPPPSRENSAEICIKRNQQPGAPSHA